MLTELPNAKAKEPLPVEFPDALVGNLNLWRSWIDIRIRGCIDEKVRLRNRPA